jgi:hypothetical protein
VGGTADLDGGKGLTVVGGGSYSSRRERGVRESRSIDKEPCGGQSSLRRVAVAMLRMSPGAEKGPLVVDGSGGSSQAIEEGVDCSGDAVFLCGKESSQGSISLYGCEGRCFTENEMGGGGSGH